MSHWVNEMMLERYYEIEYDRLRQRGMSDEKAKDIAAWMAEERLEQAGE